MEMTSPDLSPNEDMIMMEGILRRLPDALDRLSRRYHALLKSVIKQVIFDETEVEDVLQDVLIQVWNRAGSYSPAKGKLPSWLCTLARRRAIDRVRQASAYRRVTDRYEISCNHPDKAFDQTHPVETRAFQGDIRALLTKHLAALPDNQRQVIRMSYLEDLSQREISSLIHTPLGTVKTRLELGMKKLARSFKDMREKIL